MSKTRAKLSQSQSQPTIKQSQSLSQSQSQSSQAPIPERLVIGCVKILLARSCSKIPLRRQDLIQQLQSLDTAFNSKRLNAVINLARSSLNEIYGFDVRQVGVKTNLQYILILTNPIPESMIDLFPVEEETAIIISALAHIFMSGGSVTEDDLCQFLEKTSLIKPSSEDSSFNLKHFLQILTRQLYLKSVKIEEFGVETINYKWGERADLEISKMDMLKKISVALNHEPTYWFEQYKIAEEEEKKANSISSSQTISTQDTFHD